MRCLLASLVVFARSDLSQIRDVVYSYDALNRLTEVRYSSGLRIKYTHDPAGDRIKLEIVGVTMGSDFNCDGKPDTLWRNSSAGQNYLWFMNGTSLIGETFLASVPDTNWKIVGAADFNGDGKSDILWRNTVTGSNYLWYMKGVTRIGEAFLETVGDLSWRLVGIADFSADRKPDLPWRNTATGVNYVWLMNGVVLTTGSYLDTVKDPNWQMILQPY